MVVEPTPKFRIAACRGDRSPAGLQLPQARVEQGRDWIVRAGAFASETKAVEEFSYLQSALHCPIAANDFEPAMAVATPTVSSPPTCAAGRVSRAGSGPGQREKIHHSAQGLPVTRRYTGHFTRLWTTAGHSLNSRLFPGPCGGPTARCPPQKPDICMQLRHPQYRHFV